VNYRHNKFGAIVQGGINRERTPYNYSSTETYTPGFEVLQQGKNKVTNFSHHGNSVFSYEIDSLNLVTVDVGASGNILKNDVNNFGASRQTNNPLTSTYLFELDLQETGSQWNLNTNYQRNFRKAKDRFLTFSYLFRKSKTDNELLNVLAQQQNYDGNNYRQTSNGFVSNNALQLDYVHPVKNGRIETGAKYIYRNIDNSFSTTIIHPVSGVSFPDTANTDQLDYALSILGFYHSYQIKIKSFAFRAGFRLEHTSLDGNFKFGKQNITQDYNNLLPSARLQYRTEKSGLFSLSFRQQIQRPGLGLLNPLVVKTAPGYNQAGNPNLKPVLISFFSLEFSKYAKASTSLIF
jgi:ferric enterobactin receptor